MGSCGYHQHVNDDCPVCGLKEGAFTGKTEWNHTHPCCGDKCGLELEGRLDAFEASREFKRMGEKIDRLKGKLRDAYFKKTGVICRDTFRGCY